MAATLVSKLAAIETASFKTEVGVGRIACKRQEYTLEGDLQVLFSRAQSKRTSHRGRAVGVGRLTDGYLHQCFIYGVMARWSRHPTLAPGSTS